MTSQVSGDIYAPLVIVNDNTLYVATVNGLPAPSLYALNSSDFSLKWVFEADSDFYAAPLIGSDGFIYIQTQFGDLSVFMKGMRGLT